VYDANITLHVDVRSEKSHVRIACLLLSEQAIPVDFTIQTSLSAPGVSADIYAVALL
jgi:hypothetical protein